MTEAAYELETGPNRSEARFSHCRRFRYSLKRRELGGREAGSYVAFVMLNPSTADAFKLDPTVRRCVDFATRWGYDGIEVVNLYALRSPHPRDLRLAWDGSRRAMHRMDVTLDRVGAGVVNGAHILSACANAEITIAAWGNHGHDPKIGNRGDKVRALLEGEGIELYHLGTSLGGAPLHPLARGKSWIPATQDPIRWAA